MPVAPRARGRVYNGPGKASTVPVTLQGTTFPPRSRFTFSANLKTVRVLTRDGWIVESVVSAPERKKLFLALRMRYPAAKMSGRLKKAAKDADLRAGHPYGILYNPRRYIAREKGPYLLEVRYQDGDVWENRYADLASAAYAMGVALQVHQREPQRVTVLLSKGKRLLDEKTTGTEKKESRKWYELWKNPRYTPAQRVDAMLKGLEQDYRLGKITSRQYNDWYPRFSACTTEAAVMKTWRAYDRAFPRRNRR